MTELSAPVDPRILGKILLIQTTLHVNPTPAGIAEFVCRGLDGFPDIAAIAIRIGDVIRSSSPDLAAQLHAVTSDDLHLDNRSTPLASGAPTSDKRLVTIAIESLHTSYGAIFLDTLDPPGIAPYRPFLESLANTIALTIENQENEIVLKRLNEDLLRANEGLESMVMERTSELMATNAALVQEMTERKLAEKEQAKLQSQLAQVQKMESIGLLAGGIAHDFNNILAAIVGYSNILQREIGDDNPLRLYVDPILTASERAAGLTQSLLAFSRKQVISPKIFDLNTHLRRVDKFLSRIIGEDIVMSFSLADQPLTIFADPTNIEQILLNLATNARDAMPHGGILAIETGRVEDAAAKNITHSFGHTGPCAVLSVSDTGTGMDEETRGKIFEPFFSTKELGQGTGLGLAIVYGVVKQNKGHINVYSEIGRGTTFKIYFPLVEEESGVRELIKPSLATTGGKETILLAEDNDMVRELTRHLLTGYGYTVIEAADGEEALSKFRQHGDTIELILADVIMPKMSGRQFCEEALKAKPDIKIIFTSGYPADLVQKEGILEPGLHFIAKPSSPETLLRKVRELLDSQGS
jgi:signal transduction histidine kinase/CheY-like chemotaxis protein